MSISLVWSVLKGAPRDAPKLAFFSFFTVISAAVIAKAKLLSSFNLLMCEIVKTMRLMCQIWDFSFKQMRLKGDFEQIYLRSLVLLTAVPFDCCD